MKNLLLVAKQRHSKTAEVEHRRSETQSLMQGNKHSATSSLLRYGETEMLLTSFDTMSHNYTQQNTGMVQYGADPRPVHNVS